MHHVFIKLTKHLEADKIYITVYVIDNETYNLDKVAGITYPDITYYHYYR